MELGSCVTWSDPLEQQLSSHPRSPFLQGSHTAGHCTFTLVAPGPDPRRPGTTPIFENLAEIIKIS